MTPTYQHALIVGAGPGLSASLARLFVSRGIKATMARRSAAGGSELSREMAGLGVVTELCDVADANSVAALFSRLDASGAPDVVLFNPSARARGSVVDLDAAEVARAVTISAMGGFHVAQEAARRMVPMGHGAILFTGASASVKGFPLSAPFAMGKFALRGLAQSLARELHPKGIHVGHVVIDGGIRSPERDRVESPDDGAERQDRFLDPDAVARSYASLLDQDRSAWSWEIEVRPWVERF